MGAGCQGLAARADIFTEFGSLNATWVWCPNIGGSNTRDLADLYPGDAYVDWTCLDGYNKYDTWLSFGTVFSNSGINWLDNSYANLVALAPGKAIMIGETGSQAASTELIGSSQFTANEFAGLAAGKIQALP